MVSALITAGFSAIGIYIGFTRGAGKTVDITLDKIEKKTQVSPTIQRLVKALEMTDKLFGDDQAVEQITRFFKEAADLVSSEEAKNFFKNATGLMKGLGEPQKIEFKMPKREKG